MTTPARKSCLLSPDDLAPRMYITIHSGRMKRRCMMFDSTEDDFESIGSAPTPPAGVPMQVLEVNLPFVACSVPQPGGVAKGPVILDVRNLNLQRVDPKFVRAIRRFKHKTANEAEGASRKGNGDPDLLQGAAP